MPANTLIIQTAFIGDVILTTPLIHATKAAFPEARVSMLVIPSTANILGNNPYLEEVIRYDKKGRDRGLSSLLRLAHALSARSFDLAMLPHRSFRSAALAALARIPRRIGFDVSPTSFLFTDVVPYRQGAHEVERNGDLLRALDIEPEPESPRIFPDDKDHEVADILLGEHMEIDRVSLSPPLPFSPSDGKGRRVALAPGSIWPTKRWPLAYFAQVAELLMKAGVRVILMGGPSDRALCNEIARRTTHAPLIAAGQLTLRESAALLAQCDLLLTNDSAPAHMAAAMGTPVFAVFGPTTTSLGFAPYGPGHTILEVPLDCRPCGKHGGKKCPNGHFRCMKDLAPERVFGEMMAKLKRT
ncbi:MAG: lipopolysaccharide heptosyltransferase II [Candidatus Latescibacterota bacterium]